VCTERFRQASLPDDISEGLAKQYEDRRRTHFYAGFDVDEEGNVALVDTQYVRNGIPLADCDITICVPSDSTEAIKRAFREQAEQQEVLERLESSI
jgi:hypothetical protein